MVKKYKKESDKTILIIMIITFVVSFLLLLFFINYLDEIYRETAIYPDASGELGSSGIFTNPATNPITHSKEVLEGRFGIYGIILFFVILLLLIISGTYLFFHIKNLLSYSTRRKIK